MKIGTSMAAPYVTGVAALIRSIRLDLSALEVKSIILSSVDKVSGLSGKVLTRGRPNAYKAVVAARNYGRRGRLLSGNCDGDGTPEFAAFYNEGAGMSLRVWEYSQKPFDTFHGRVVCSSPAFNIDNLGDRIVTGDFDGDGKCDIAAFYDYGLQSNRNYLMTVWRWKGATTSEFPFGDVCTSTDFDAAQITGSVVAGDFSGDGKCDMAALYQYPLGYGFFRFLGSSTSSFPHGLQRQYY